MRRVTAINSKGPTPVFKSRFKIFKIPAVDKPLHFGRVCRSEIDFRNKTMPNTKSAERRMRSNVRKQTRNRSTKSRLGTLERRYAALAGEGKKDEAAGALRSLTSALDKAAKTGVIHWAAADRKKSRLSARLNAIQ
jgi:small subunit ribosomal protein S20